MRVLATMLGACNFGAGTTSAIVSHCRFGGDSAMQGYFLTGTCIINACPTHIASGTVASTFVRSILSLALLSVNKVDERLGIGC